MLGYRLRDLELAVEDFRTSPRPPEAADHVEEEAARYGRALSDVVELAGCAP
jgi:hypothetical protein